MTPSGRKLTPTMRHYLELKQQYPDALLLYRLGDFYELFFEDAITASRALDLVLTSRDKNAPDPIPMCGVPHHAVDGYIKKLLEQGFKVAICEQMEDPKKAKGLVRREVVRVLTPGLNVEEDSSFSNYLVAVAQANHKFGLAALELSTGEFLATETETVQEVISELHRLAPREILISREEESLERRIQTALTGVVFTRRDPIDFERASERICSHFGCTTLDGYGLTNKPAASAAAAAALVYLVETQKSTADHIEGITYYEPSAHLVLDEKTREHLEITHSQSGGRHSTLLGVLDFTLTRPGQRLLYKWLTQPLRSVEQINQRLDAVEELIEASIARSELRELLKGVADIERVLGRLALGRGNARDLSALRELLERAPSIQTALEGFNADLIRTVRDDLTPPYELLNELKAALVDDPPATITEGGMFRRGYNPELDELIELATEGKNAVLRIEQQERQRTGIPSLKIRYNKVFGYYIEVTKAHLDKVPPNYIRKQTIASGERFITEELKQFEDKILGAEERRKQLELALFEALRSRVMEHLPQLKRMAFAAALLDVLLSAAEAASRYNYTRPMVDDSTVIELTESRHPVVERTLKGERFVPNDVLLDTETNRLMIITGPNMAGKSTVIRQVGLIVIMAQAGLFVPAKAARIGIVDRVFTRIGAADVIARGKSTFLVEMEETARILHQATKRSLILLDEIGRGTSTFDGVSIAWAVAEYIHDRIAARTMFATHYHELTELELTCEGVVNYNVAVKEWGDEVVFLHKLVRGGTNHSYGIYVGKMAGLPQTVVERAREILADLEKHALTPPGAKNLDQDEMPAPFKPRKKRRGPKVQYQPSLFEWAASRVEKARLVEEELANLNLENLTPVQALAVLEKLKRLLND